MSKDKYYSQYEPTVRNYASLSNINPDLAVNVMRMESSGDPTARPIGKSGRPLSSAVGLYQILDNTWKGLGGTTDDRYDPDAQARLGVKYLADNKAYLQKNLGRDVQDHEVYMSHLLGPAGAKALLTADPNSNIYDVVSGFSKNPDAVINNNAMDTSMTAGQAINLWQQKYSKIANNNTPSIPQIGAVKPNPIPQIPATAESATAQSAPVETVYSVAKDSGAVPVQQPVQQQEVPEYRGLANSLLDQNRKLGQDSDLLKKYYENMTEKSTPAKEITYDMSGLADALAKKSYGYETNIGSSVSKKPGSKLNFTNL
jgi:hypothetical protein